MFRSASHAVEAGSRFVRKFSEKLRRHRPLHRNSAEMFRSANAYKDCGLTGWAKKADYVECIRAMAKVIKVIKVHKGYGKGDHCLIAEVRKCISHGRDDHPILLPTWQNGSV